MDVAIILIGEEMLPNKLKPFERIHGRMLGWVQAEPADFSDIKHLSRIYCPNVSLSERVIQKVATASSGSVLRICVNLDRIREYALTNNLKSI